MAGVLIVSGCLLGSGTGGTSPEAAAAALSAGSCQVGTGPPDGTTGPGGVDLDVVGRGWIWCSYAVLDANLDITTPPVVYPEQVNNGQPVADSFVSDAVYLDHLLELAGIASARVTELQVERDAPEPVVLTATEVTQPYPDGAVPLIWFDGDETYFERPPTSATDDNNQDSIVASAGVALSMYVYTGPVLSVAITDSPSSGAKAGQAVQFAALVQGAAPTDGTLTYAWDFGDGGSANGPEVSHTYTTPGTYAVTATVTGAPTDALGGTPAGVSPTLDVEVGNGAGTANAVGGSTNPIGGNSGTGQAGRGVAGGSSGVSPVSTPASTVGGGASTTTSVPAPVTSEASTSSKPGRQPAAGAALQLISGQLLAATAPNADGGASLSPLPAAIDRVEASPAPQLDDTGWLVATVLTVVVLAAGGLSEVRSRRRAGRQV